MAREANTVEAFMPWWIADYLRDTQHLTRDQHGGYLLLLASYWVRGGPLPDDDARLAATVRASVAEWRKLRPILAEFFTVGAGVWRSKRADAELARAIELKAKRTERATKASHARLKGHPQDDRQDDPGDIPKESPETSISSLIAHQVEAKASPSPSRKRSAGKVSLPSDWEPNEAHRTKAEAFGVDCDWHAGKMRNWAAAGGALCKDWDARFHNWLATEKERADVKSTSGPTAGERRREGNLAAALASLGDRRGG